MLQKRMTWGIRWPRARRLDRCRLGQGLARGNHRAFKSLTEAKGWEMEDIVMETDVATLSLGPTYEIYLPVFMKSYVGSRALDQ